MRSSPPPTPAPATTTLPAVQAYYQQTWLDYRWFWLNRRNPAIHFGYWDATVHSHRASLLAMNRFMADAVSVHPGDVVLDAGCGVGATAVWLAETRSVRVHGITVVDDQVRRARRLAQRRGVASSVTFANEDYRHPGLHNASVDVVWAQESLCHAPDKQAFVAAARRVLRPGGRLVVTEYLRSPRTDGAGGDRLLHRWLAGWAIPDLATAAELEGWLRAAGFVDIVTNDVTAEVRRSLRRLYVLTSVIYPLEVAGRALRLRSAVQHGNAVGARTQWHALRRGLWRYCLVTARLPESAQRESVTR